MPQRDARLIKAVNLVAAIAAAGHPDILFNEDDTISHDRIEQVIGISAASAAFLVQNQSLAREALGKEDFEKLAAMLDFTGLEDEMTFGSARFADKEDA